jgi:hypothetical protein
LRLTTGWLYSFEVLAMAQKDLGSKSTVETLMLDQALSQQLSMTCDYAQGHDHQKVLNK